VKTSAVLGRISPVASSQQLQQGQMEGCSVRHARLRMRRRHTSHALATAVRCLLNIFRRRSRLSRRKILHRSKDWRVLQNNLQREPNGRIPKADQIAWPVVHLNYVFRELDRYFGYPICRYSTLPAAFVTQAGIKQHNRLTTNLGRAFDAICDC
jgi:hypothetical protein